MCSARVPGSLRVAYRVSREQKREPISSSKVIAAACLMAASPVAMAAAQEAPAPASTPLPTLQVETKSSKPKTAAKPKKKSSTSAAQAPTPTSAPQQPTAQPAGADGANPYANPNAPYMVERSGSAKLTEPLVNQPRTITAVPKEVIADKGATSIRELARQTPGVTIGFAEGGNAFGDAIAIRGFSARNDIFVDGVRDPGNVSREAFAIEQVEIYKGPSGVISGRGTPGGAVNIITKQPVLGDSFYETETKVGTDETFRQTVDINQTITRDFAVRANLLYNTNEVAGRDFAEDERWGGQFSAKGRVSDDVTVTLDYYRLRSDGVPDWGVPVSITDKVPYTELGLDRSTWYGNASRDFIKNESDVGTATIVAKLTPDIKLTNVTRVGTNGASYVASAARPAAGQPSPPLNLVNVTTPQRLQSVDSFSNHTDAEFKFNTGSFKHTVVAGVEYSRDAISRSSYSVGSTAAQDIFNPNPYRTDGQITGTSLVYDATIEDVGVYLNDTVELSKQWIINGGVRLDAFRRDQVGATSANTALREDTLTNYYAGIVYKPVDIASIYASYATAETPIGSDLDSTGITYNGLSAATLPLEPEKTTGIEVGTKWELFDRRMLATAALFQTTKDDARTNGSTVASGNAGKYRVQGVELSVAGNITSRWSMFGGIVLMDTEVLESDNPAEIGRRMANIPLTQFALLSAYQLTDQLRVGGQAIYSSEFYSGFYATNDNGYHTVPFWRFDAFAEYKIDNHWSVELQGVNLTDELYYDAIYQASNSFAFVAPGRSGYLSVKWKY